jgi:hypothetical protein
MSTSLKELRELSSNIEKKKKELRETERHRAIEEKNRLKRESAQQAKERAAQAEAAAKKAKRLRQTALTGGIAAMLIAVAVSIRIMVLAWSGDDLGSARLITSDLESLNPGDPAYAKAAKFAKDVIASFKKNQEEYEIPFHPAIPDDSMVASEERLSDAAGTSWTLADVKKDGVSGALKAEFSSGTKRLTVEIVKTEGGFKVLKVY